MDLISVAVPFFLLAIVIEIAVDRRRGTGYIPLADALGSISAGAMSTATGIFSKVLGFAIFAYALEHWAIVRMPEAWFDLSISGILCWLGALLLWDFMYYWKHRLGHERSLFWAAHSVHHQSEEYNLTTALRQTSTDFLIGWTVYVPLFLIGLPLKVFITVGAIDLIYQFWVHTRHIDKLGWLDRVFVTPSNHRVHHAQNEQYIDKNYGGILVVWDRLFGTFKDEDDTDPVVFGVRKPLRSFNPLTANLQVYQYLWFDAKGTQSWRDKVMVWIGRTGWRPSDMQMKHPSPTRSVAAFEKYYPQRRESLNVYLLFQFFVAVAITFATQLWLPTLSLPLLVANTMLCVLLIGLGLVNDGQHNAGNFEAFRVIASIVAIVWLLVFVFAVPMPIVLLLAVAYSLASLYLYRFFGLVR